MLPRFVRDPILKFILDKKGDSVKLSRNLSKSVECIYSSNTIEVGELYVSLPMKNLSVDLKFSMKTASSLVRELRNRSYNHDNDFYITNDAHGVAPPFCNLCGYSVWLGEETVFVGNCRFHDVCADKLADDIEYILNKNVKEISRYNL